MAETRKIVARVTGIDPLLQKPFGRSLAEAHQPPIVTFQNGETARLDPADPRTIVMADLIEDAREASIPLYIELDAATLLISDLRIPIDGIIKAITPDASGNMEIEIEISHAVHVLRKENAEFERLLGVAREAMARHERVALTERDNEGIIDIRLTTPEAPAASPQTARPFEGAIARPVSPTRAKQLFDMLAARSCVPATVLPPCIPFLFPDDGCWGRAHEMCRLIIAQNEVPSKVWIYGQLRVNTRNNPNCYVRWGWHVAPTLQVQTGPSVETQVVDPSLFGVPVDQVRWKGVQGDASARLAPSDASAFYRDPAGNIQTDPSYAQTNQVLARYRLQLKQRATSGVGPPPYAHCHVATV